MSLPPLEYVRHILEETDFLAYHSSDLTFERFSADPALQRAFVRSLEVIGEAVKKLPKDFTQRYPRIEWRLTPARATLLAIILGCSAVSGPATATAQDREWTAVEQALGRRGQVLDGGLYRVAMPRTDLAVSVRGIPIRPALSLGSWIGFKATGPGQVVAMGDLVLTETELNPVLSRLQRGGVGAAAIHQHLPDHSPPVWWAHIHGRGNGAEIAATVRAALALTGTPATGAAPPPGPEPPLGLDTAAVRQALGRGGRASGGVYQVSAARAETIRAMGIDVPAAMGVGTVINFQPTGDGQAAVNGDFAMVPGEVDSVLQALRAHDIEIVAVHNHLTSEEPRLVFVHFWGHANAVALARGLRAALERTNVR